MFLSSLIGTHRNISSTEKKPPINRLMSQHIPATPSQIRTREYSTCSRGKWTDTARSTSSTLIVTFGCCDFGIRECFVYILFQLFLVYKSYNAIMPRKSKRSISSIQRLGIIYCPFFCNPSLVALPWSSPSGKRKSVARLNYLRRSWKRHFGGNNIRSLTQSYYLQLALRPHLIHSYLSIYRLSSQP